MGSGVHTATKTRHSTPVKCTRVQKASELVLLLSDNCKLATYDTNNTLFQHGATREQSNANEAETQDEGDARGLGALSRPGG